MADNDLDDLRSLRIAREAAALHERARRDQLVVIRGAITVLEGVEASINAQVEILKGLVRT